jgi:hypothetical protein
MDADGVLEVVHARAGDGTDPVADSADVDRPDLLRLRGRLLRGHDDRLPQ